MMQKISALFLAFLLGGCAVIGPYISPKIDTGENWKNGDPTTSTIKADWWTIFNDPQLTGFVTNAQSGNTDLRAAIQRIEQSRAQLKIANAALFPAISAGANISRNSTDFNSSSTSYTGNVAVSYELDLWQKNRNTRKAAAFDLNATIYDRHALALTVTSETAQRYFEILTLRERIRLTEENIKIFTDVSGLIEARFKEGAASGLEVAQQNTALANAQASLSTLNQQLATTINALAILLGQNPQDFHPEFVTKLDQLPVPQINPLQPSALLQRRPDVRAQEEGLKAAYADVAVARTNIYPAVNIGATASLAANSLSASPNGAVNALAQVAQRIFEAGRLEGEVELAKARELELVENYRTTVLVAFRETEDALVAIKTATEREASLATALKASQDAYAIAKDRYLNGADDFLTLLDAQRTLLTAQDNYAQAKLARLATAVQLYQALGGGWQG